MITEVLQFISNSFDAPKDQSRTQLTRHVLKNIIREGYGHTIPVMLSFTDSQNTRTMLSTQLEVLRTTEHNLRQLTWGGVLGESHTKDHWIPFP